MDDMLKYAVNFDLEQGLKQAQEDWKKVDKQLQAMVSDKGIKIKVSVPTSKNMTELEQVAIRLQKLKLEPVTPETRNAIRTLVAELKNMEKILLKLDKLNSKGIGQGALDTARVNKINQQASSQAALAEERLAAAKLRTEQAQLRLDAAQRRATTTTHAHTSAYSKQAGMLDSLKRSFAAYTGMFAVMQIVRKIKDVTAEFELQRVALGAIIQDKNKADQLFSQIKVAALESPFQVKELVSYTKQLSAYRIETEQLFETTMRLADISAGLGVEMDRLVLAYGQVKAASVLRGQELRQFTEAGIPLVQLLAEKFTALNGQLVSTADVFELISNRAVSFDMVKEIFEEMTNEGGVFYNMQQIQAKTLAGSWSNLKDAADIAFNDIGQSQYGLMKGSIEVTKSLFENWETVKNTINTLVASYTIYKIALIATSTQQGLFSKALIGTTAAGAGVNAIIAKMIIGIKGIGLAIKTNPFGFLLSALTAVVGALITFDSANKKMTEEQQEVTKGIYKERLEINSLIDSLKNENLTQADRLKIMNKISGYSQELASNITKETEAISDQTEKVKALIKIQEEYNKKKEAEFVLQRFSMSTGFEDVVKDFQEIEIDFQQSKAQLIDEYTDFWNRWNIISNEGAKVGNNQKGDIIRFFGKDEVENINSIINSQKDIYQKSIELEKWYRTEKNKLNTTSVNSEFAYREKLLKSVFSGLTSYDYQENLKDFTDTQKQMEASTQKMADKISKYYTSLYGDLSKASIKTKSEISEVIMSIKNIPDVTKKDLIIKVGVQIGDEDIKASLRNLDGLRGAVNTIFEKWKTSISGFGSSIKPETIIPEEGVNLTNYISDQRKRYKDLTEEIKNEQIARKKGFPTMGEAILQQKEYEKALMQTIAANLGYTLSEKQASAARKSQQDILKEEISLVETAYKAYQELEKQIGSAAAKKAIEKQFGGQTKTLALAFSDEALIAELKKAQNKAKTEADKIAIGVKIDKVSFDALMEDLKKKIDDVKTLIDNEKQKINFYDAIFEKTGREDLAKLFTQNIYGGLGDLQKMLKDQVDAVFVNPMKATGVDMTEFTKSISEATKGAKIDYIALQKLISQLPEESRKSAEEVVKSGIESNAKIIEDLMESLKETESFEKKKTDIIQKGIKERELLISQGLPETDAAFVQSIKKQEEALASLAVEQLKSSELWATIFDNLDKISKTSIDTLITKIKNLISVEGKNMTLEELKAMNKALKDLESASSGRNPFEAITNGLKEYIAAQIEYQKYRSSGIEDAEKENQILAKLTTAREKVAKGYEAVTQVVGQLKSLMDGFIDLLGITEDSEAGQVMLEFAKALGFVATALGVVATMAVIAETALAPVLLPILAISAAVAGLIALGKWFSGADTRKANKEIKKQEQILDNLKEKYEALEKAQEDAFGKEYLQNYQQQLKNLQAQQVAYEKQAAAEKKKGKDADEDAIAEAEANAKAAAKDAADLQKQLLERFTGTDLTSFARDFAKAWLDAYIEVGRTGANTTNELKKKWKDLVKNMIVEGMLAAAVQGAFKGIFDKITALYETGKIPTAEQLNSFNQEGFGIIDMLGTTLPQLLEGLDLSALGDSVSGLSGLAKGIEGITEQQANVLSAAINTQNYYIIDIWTLLKKWDADRSGGGVTLGSLITIQNTYLQELPIIRDNTARTALACEKSVALCQDTLDTMKSVIYPINGKKAINTTMS